MSTKRILSVGQCSADHAGIRWFLTSSIKGVEVDPASSEAEAFAAMGKKTYDLVLVNRVLDRDRASGTDIIGRIKADEKLGTIPVMLVSNFADAQAKAAAVGALPGFGKSDLDDDALVKVRAALGLAG